MAPIIEVCVDSVESALAFVYLPVIEYAPLPMTRLTDPALFVLERIGLKFVETSLTEAERPQASV